MAIDKSAEVNSFLTAGKIGLTEALSCAQKISPLTSSPISILIALSGGIDSTALLLMLNSLSKEFNLTLYACHVNHHVRAEEADKDEEFCRQLCQKLAVPLTVEHLDAPTDLALVSEEKLRQSRYERLTKIAHAKDISLIATAHIKDDQIETLLFRLFRGTGRTGLTGMPIARKLSDNVVLIRPMLNIVRAQCQAYLDSCGQNARLDSSNNNIAYRRNFIRHQVIPVIKQQFSSFVESMERFRSLNEEEEAFISSVVDSALAELSANETNKWHKSLFLKLPLAIQRRVLWQGLRFRQIEPSFERIDACRQAILADSAISLNENWDLRISEDFIAWVDKSNLPANVCEPWQVQLKIPGTTMLLPIGHALKIEEIGQAAPAFPGKSSLTAIIDLSRAQLPLTVRTRMPGDVIQPFGMQEMVKLKKYLHNHKPTGEQNPLANIVLADQNEVLWVPGIGLSNKLKVTDKPSHLLTWLKLAPDCAIC